ncbi:MAG: DUF4294 domain-containing protein [Lewinella sp.]|jgi:hypothetical protein|uniref:DUF4294 domain-containing protein n=1 Tax=Lewinella sp. TaxID=2004506 RepID=UPI003D6C6081
MKYLILSSLIIFFGTSLTAQETGGYTRVNDQYYKYMIDDCGDTLIVASLEGISISSLRAFENEDDYRRYRRYRQYALKVYPYAVQAIRIFRETEYALNNLSNRESKRYIRQLQRELKDEFADPLKNLSKTQGLILIKMIERELDTPMYELIKDLRGGITATYWNTMGKLFGHSIKDGYIKGEDRILDAVLDDFNVSYDVPAAAGN